MNTALPAKAGHTREGDSSTSPGRRWPVGAEVHDGRTHFRVWAPQAKRVEVVVESAPANGSTGAVALEAEGNGYFSDETEVGAGTRYRYRLDGGGLFPDPMSRFQPDGPHGPSEVIDPSAFSWTDRAWKGPGHGVGDDRRLQGQVAYELHVGTFTPQGTWESAVEQLPRLADLGITLLEVMPVADFPGRFGWGYDGVDLFAPTRLYGRPDDFRRFVDRAHALGMAVILDVVYNHLGPDGNFLKAFAPAYFSTTHKTDWGEAINFDGPDAGPVREFFLTNAAYWIDEYHLDGLRLDATQNIYDDSPGEHILAGIARVTRRAGGDRSVVLIAENEPQETRLVRSPAKDGYGLDGLWNDDFHHSAHVAATGRTAAYYTDYRGRPQEFISAAKYGYLSQGQWYCWQKNPRGTPALDLPPCAFVTFLDNHDQVANSALGRRLHALTSPARYRALTALLLLGPGTPMLFQGQEFASSAPFYYFADHKPELAGLVRDGRREFMSQFANMKVRERSPVLPDPHDLRTFAACRLDPAEVERHAWAVALHRDLLRLRRETPAFQVCGRDRVDGAVLAEEAFLLRFFGPKDEDRLLLVNLGRDLDLRVMPEPLLAPPRGRAWELAWSSEDPRYGGEGVAPTSVPEAWEVPASSALVFAPRQKGEP